MERRQRESAVGATEALRLAVELDVAAAEDAGLGAVLNRAAARVPVSPPPL